MFETEAEKYATRECCTACKNINHSCKEKCECWTFAKKGAEFGYNKGKSEAKEIIRELLLSDTRKGSDWVGYLIDLKERAEQFLRESA